MNELKRLEAQRDDEIEIDLGEIFHLLLNKLWVIILCFIVGGVIGFAGTKILVISDNGIGIAEEDLPRIFEKGFTGYNGRANKKSTGIGLYLCKTIIDRLHHTIWIESKPEKGTKVYLNFDREHRRIE